MSAPEKIFMIGPCRVSVFRNAVSKHGKKFEIPKVVFETRWKDKKTGKWNGTNSATLNELPKLILALQKAYEHCLSLKSNKKPDADIY